MLDKLENNNDAGLLFLGKCLIDSHGIDGHTTLSSKTTRSFLDGCFPNFFLPWLIKKSFFLMTEGFDENIPTGVEFDIALKMEEVAQAVKIENSLYEQAIEPQSNIITSSINASVNRALERRSIPLDAKMVSGKLIYTIRA